MSGVASIESALVFVAFLAGSVAAAGAMAWTVRFGDRRRPDRTVLIAASGLIALWCALGAALSATHPASVVAFILRNLALIAVIFRLFSVDGRDASLKPIRPVILALVLAEALQLLLLTTMSSQPARSAEVGRLAAETGALIDIMVSIGGLLLLHNLFAGASPASRRTLRLLVIGLAGIFAFDLNLHTTAFLSGTDPDLLVGIGGLVAGAMAVLMALGSSRTAGSLQFSPSRAVTFRTLSLLLIGGYLAGMVLVARMLALLGGDIARASQVVFLVIAVLAAGIWLPSQRLRGWLRVMATKHLFEHRYDYREEWLRFTRTIGTAAAASASLQERAVKALADITESPAGLLLTPNEEAQLELTARWNWPAIEVPAVASDHVMPALLEQHSFVLALDEVRTGTSRHVETADVPEWLLNADDAWAVVPLLHFDRLVGAIVLARPRIERRLDWEDFDLLKIAGQQLASYLSEQAGQQALMDASRFDEFNRRMAFVMHDIKNLASQLSLLAANAQKHADNPAFRADMLLTLRNSSDKLGALLARLGRYSTGPVNDLRQIDLASVARSVADRFGSVHPVSLTCVQPVMVTADAEALEQALIHLVQNAVDASAPDDPVVLDITSEGLFGRIDVIDCGHGMSPEFVRTGLFKPFVSSKPSGFGIGAFEAREMIRAMGGRVMVESREDVGTRFSIILPTSETTLLFDEPLPVNPAKSEVA